MEKINSIIYPGMMYEPSKDLWLDAKEAGTTFSFSVRSCLTESKSKMNLIGAFLDDIENIKKAAYDTLVKILTDTTNKYHDTVTYFLEFHRNEFDDEQFSQLLGISVTKNVTLKDMVKCLKLNGVTCDYHAGWKELTFILDFSFDTAFTDELLVMHFNSKKEVIIISHEN